MAEVLLISKPVEPPWNDSSKNLVRDLASAIRRHVPAVMPRRGGASSIPGVRERPVYGATAGGYAPALRDNARVFGSLLLGAKADLWHFFFAPNRRSSRVGSLASAARGVPTVHTVCSAPAEGADLRRVLFADRTVVLSRHTEQRFREGGVDASRLRRIPPSIPPLDVRDDAARQAARVACHLPETAPIVVYPGDLEFGSGARRCVEALRSLPNDVVLVLACRTKTMRAEAVAAELRDEVARGGLRQRVFFVGETPRIHDLLACADLVALPAESLYAKMDYPLVLLEAMCLERAVLVATGTPGAELAEDGGAVAVAPVAEAVASEIARLLGDDDARRRLGRRARATVLDRYGPGALARSYEALYDELLGTD
jgi:phosphatidylinositol alpha-1,6-mannosyltransferase